jgi:hypothetical protein
MTKRIWFPNRSNKVPAFLFVIWGLFCLALLGAGAWMIGLGVEYRRTHNAAEAMIEVENRQTRRGNEVIAHLRYEAEGRRIELYIPRPRNAPKEERRFNEIYRNGGRISIWYPKGQPESADEQGDHGVLIGGIAFTAVGALFMLVGILAFIAAFFPNRFVRFG